MTHTNQRQQNAPGNVSASPRDISTNPSHSLMPNTDSVSDNDTSEKPVREKLKKTSLASMSGHIVGIQEIASEANEEIFAQDDAHRDSSPEQDSNKRGAESRGRPMKERSFDDLDTPEAQSIGAEREQVAQPKYNGHLRKRSRDVRAGEISEENRRPLLVRTPVREEAEDTANGFETSEACINGSRSTIEGKSPPLETRLQVEMDQDNQVMKSIEPVQPIPGEVQKDQGLGTRKVTADQEMRDLASVPQKKRSRDQFDTEADREQKILATEEARAHRRSDELERGEFSATRGQSPVLLQGNEIVAEKPVTVEEGSSLISRPGLEGQEQPFRSAFGSTSTLSPSMTFARNDSIPKFSTFATKTTDQESQSSTDTFASSGFAAFEGSSTSPFGTLAGSSTTATNSPFASAGAFTLGKTETDKRAAPKPETIANSGFGTFVNSSSTGFGTMDQSPFGLSPTTGFGNSVFGSAFGGPLSGGSRLTSFAAPTGNAKLGTSNGAIKPIGSPRRDEDEIENSESEDEGIAENKKDDETEEADVRFQHQDVETGEGGEDSIFSSRASLYSFRDNAWKESGKGTFKLNIAPASSGDAPSDRKTGRFIMRAHQTYRVLLNVPVFKQMQVGDSRGNEPSGKSFLFAVIENAKPVAHMLKLGDLLDSRTLYHEVRRLQKGLE